MQVEPWWMLVSPQALQLVHHLDFRLMTRSQKAIMKSTVVVNFSSSHWKSEVKQWKSKAEHEIKLKNTSPILYVSSKQKMHSENRWWNFDRHQQKISIANELQKTFLTTSKSEITGEVLRKTWGVTSNILWKSVRCFYGQNKFAYCTKCAFARKKVGCRAVAREALDHIEPSLARQRGS